MCVSASRPAAQSSRIQYNETVQSEIAENATEEQWEFDGHTGDLILIDMRADGSNLDTYLTLLDPFGNPLLSDDDSGEGLNSRIGPYRLPSDGIYTILAGRYGGSGGYLLELKNLSTLPDDHPWQTPGRRGGFVAAHRLFSAAPGDERKSCGSLAVTDDQLNSDPYLALYGRPGCSPAPKSTAASSIDPIVPLSDETYIVGRKLEYQQHRRPLPARSEHLRCGPAQDGVPQTGTIDYDVYRRASLFSRGRGADGPVNGIR